MSDRCIDCNCRVGVDGMCSNCHEELYILTYQGDYIEDPLSDKFIEKATKQEKARKRMLLAR